MSTKTGNVSIEDETRTCARCSPIKLGVLKKTRHGRWRILFTIQDLSQPLTDLHCPTCQILQTAIDVHRSKYASAQVCWSSGRDHDTHIGTLEFRYSNGNTCKISKPGLRTYHVDSMPRISINLPPKRVDFEQAKTWINACKESHPGCTARSPKVLKSLRMIDCVTKSVISAPEDCVYVALSYVWGVSVACDAPSSSARLDQLPLTVDNSIDATLMLGYRYLWVDKYCIDQTSAADKHDQINQMGAIYSSAEVTLVAAAGTNSAYGLPGVPSDRVSCGHDVTIGRLRFVTDLAPVSEEIHQSVWSSRAWTFQEGYVSKRRLYFTDSRLFYTCDKESYCDAETDPHISWSNSLGPLHLSLPVKGGGMDVASDILTEYTRRKLTFDSDALNGIVGVLNTLSKAESPIFHTWGVTFGGTPLAISLQWLHLSPCSRRRASFPSWSPLGWEGVADYSHYPPLVISPSFQVDVWNKSKFIQLSKVKQDLHQQISVERVEKSRYLKITAKLGSVEVRYFSLSELLSTDKSTFEVLHYPSRLRAGFHLPVSAGKDAKVYAGILPYWDSEPDLASEMIRVPCALIPECGGARSMAVIMLRNHGTHYERIGLIRYLRTYTGEGSINVKDINGAVTTENVLKYSDSYSDEEVAGDFNNPEMQTFLLG